jgi:NTE family protein
MKKNEKKIGLALGSGGVKGLAHIGVIKTLIKNDIPIDFIAGASVGSLIGAGYAAYGDIEKIEEIILGTNWRYALSLLDPAWKGGIIKGKKVKKLLKQWLPDITFSDLKIPLTVIATDIFTGKKINLNKGDLISAIMASSAVPPVFKPVEFEDKILVDGGLSNPVPADIAKKMGSDIVIAVNLDSGRFNGNSTNSHKKSAEISLTKVSIRALNIMRFYLSEKYLDMADITIEPFVPEIGLIGWNKFFDHSQVEKIIKTGEDAANDALPKIRECLDR